MRSRLQKNSRFVFVLYCPLLFWHVLAKGFFFWQGEYRLICKTGDWQKRIDLPGGETIILHSDSAMIHYDATKSWTDVAVSYQFSTDTHKHEMQLFNHLWFG